MHNIRRKKKKPITLLEIMIVIFLIGLIGSVIGYNVKGSLEEGKAFRSEQGIAKLKDILQMEIANGVSPEDIVNNPKYYLKRTGLVTDANKLLKDGWGQPYLISQDGDYDISVKSVAWDRHKEKRNKKHKASKTTNVSDDSYEED
jgi:general secretion pathway protein G